MGILVSLRKLFTRPGPAGPSLVQGITPGDARGRINAMTGWSWNGGLVGSWSGEKYPGALGYPGSWSLNYEALRRRSRIAYWDSEQARALLGRLVDNVVGHGLTLEATPAWSIVRPGASEEEKRAWTRDVETRFHLWAMSMEADASGRMNLYQLTRFAFLNTLRDGEIIDILRTSPDRKRMNPLEIQFVRPEQVSGSGSSEQQNAIKARGNHVVDGIELASTGRPIAYYIRDEITSKEVRVPKYGPKSGRLFVSHTGIWDSVGQVRGVPLLASLIHELYKLTDYKVAEMEAAVINALIAAYVKPAENASSSRPLSGIVIREDRVAESESVTTPSAPPAPAHIDRGGLLVQNLKAGEDLASFDVKRPNVHFADFVKAVKSGLSAALGIPVEVLDMSFNANYSASRASLLLFWTVVTCWRAITASGFLGPIYEQWMAEEISAGRIKAEGFEQPVFRAAWLNCDWIGVPQPSIDPKAEAEAVDLRIAACLTTRERAAREYNGSEFSENAERLTVENAELAKANKSLEPKPKPAPAGNNGNGQQRGKEPGPAADEADETEAVASGSGRAR